MLNNYINSKHLTNNKIEEIRENYINARSFNHIIFSDFFLINHIKDILNKFFDLRKKNTNEKKNKNEKFQKLIALYYYSNGKLNEGAIDIMLNAKNLKSRSSKKNGR
mgnify:CR=1 FL=1